MKKVLITEIPPGLEPAYNDCPLCGGRVHSISVHPIESNEIIIATEFGGLWKTENGGKKWFHLDNLLTVFAHDIAYAADGKTVICTLRRDNRVNNSGGIWLSSDGGSTWSKPITADPPVDPRVPTRMSAYGISWSPDNPKKVYVGTDFGVAISNDNGNTWSHHMLEDASRTDGDLMQNSVRSVLALPSDKAIVLCRTGVYRSNDGGTSWNLIRGGDFADIGIPRSRKFGFKNIDISPVDSNQVFILQSYNLLTVYDVALNIFWRDIPLPSPGNTPSRGPFVRVSKSVDNSNSFDIWVGQAISLLKTTCNSIDDVRYLTASDWIKLWRLEGIHDDAGYLGLDKNKRPVLYGSDGGLFKPTNEEATKWTVAAKHGSGMNSFQITDLGGTNVKDLTVSPLTFAYLYITTQDNGIWASPTGGASWIEGDFPEGFHISAIKDAKSESEITVAYGNVADFPNNCMFTDANFFTKKFVPNVDTSGRPLDFGTTKLNQAFFVAPKKWIRIRTPSSSYREIYISQNNGENWQKKANVPFEDAGVFAVAGPSSNPIIYIPFTGSRKTPDGRQRIGLIRLTNVFDGKIIDYLDDPIKPGDPTPIYIPNNGSLGKRATMFDWQAVFGVDPNDPNYILAPDVINQDVKVSRNGGADWIIDRRLTNEITKGGAFFLYDEDEYHMQVTRISFDPYNRNRIVIGTRDVGVIVSEDHGNTWATLPNSQESGILYITNFFFTHDDTIIVSCYGRGLWEIAFHPIPFPEDLYCRRDCGFISVFDPAIIFTEPINWLEIDVAIFLNGKINGLVLTENKVKTITVTPGSIYRRYTGNTMDNLKLNIVESEQGEGFNGLEGCLAVVREGGIIKGIMLKDNEVIGIISGKQEFTDIAINPDNISENILREPDSNQLEPSPYLLISTSIPITGTSVLGNDGTIHIIARGFKFNPIGDNFVKIKFDGRLIKRTFKIMQDGTVNSQLKAPEDLSMGRHMIQVIQEIDGQELIASQYFCESNYRRF